MSAFLTKLSTSTSRKEIATAIIAVQGFRLLGGADIKAYALGTLLKKQTDELHEMLSALLGDDVTFTDEGSVMAVGFGAPPAPPAEVNGSADFAILEGKKAKKAKKEAATEEESSPAKDRGQGNALHGLDDVITVTVAANPKREGSANHARFSQLRSGMTIREYVAAVAASAGSPKRARRTLRKAVAAGYVTVTPKEG